MIKKLKESRLVKSKVLEERRRLLQGIDLARSQWQYGQIHQDHNGGKYQLLDILERRYMYLYQIAKKRKLHALE
ncbi:hypothetical protein [Ammoniphilus sp. CFH 90114]|uniref:hypothetical protein n=1 Tax=Ammoniphilus sp. CFH 90114 TaxID=2493665 RepID=UPI00100F154E|nr:hypothetical protein [Ammoniphilus sp. CFH 90114]RXT08978.1 hypothetical protein EIZ39_09375 [Ammoniphilus sp. CFH 90114]